MNSILSESPHAYIKSKSILTATFESLKNTVMLLEGVKLVMGMLLDMSKTYDTVCRGYLLKKLNMYVAAFRSKLSFKILLRSLSTN